MRPRGSRGISRSGPVGLTSVTSSQRRDSLCRCPRAVFRRAASGAKPPPPFGDLHTTCARIESWSDRHSLAGQVFDWSDRRPDENSEIRRSFVGLYPTLCDQLAIQWSFQRGFGQAVWEVTTGTGSSSFLISSFYSSSSSSTTNHSSSCSFSRSASIYSSLNCTSTPCLMRCPLRFVSSKCPISRRGLASTPQPLRPAEEV